MMCKTTKNTKHRIPSSKNLTFVSYLNKIQDPFWTFFVIFFYPHSQQFLGWAYFSGTMRKVFFCFVTTILYLYSTLCTKVFYILGIFLWHCTIKKTILWNASYFHSLAFLWQRRILTKNLWPGVLRLRELDRSHWK